MITLLPGLFWLAVAALFFALFAFQVAGDPALYPAWLPTPAFYWLLGFIAAAPVAVGLLRRRPWARPVAAQYYLWLGAAFWMGAVFLRPYPLLLDLPFWEGWDMPTREYSLMTLWVICGAASLLTGHILAREGAARYFAAKPTVHPAVCPDCGSLLKGRESCRFCARLKARYLYYLAPVENGLRPLALRFEPGHWQIALGRGVGPAEAQLDETAVLSNGEPAYLMVGRHHATLCVNPENGALSVAAEQGYEVRVNDHLAKQDNSLKIGDLLSLHYLGDSVQLVVSSPQEQALMLRLLRLNDEKEEWFVLTSREERREFTLGRDPDNYIVVEDRFQGVSRKHVRFRWEVEGGDLLVQNLSMRENSLFVNNVLVGQTAEDEPESGGFVVIPLSEIEAKGFVNIDIDVVNYRLYPHLHMLELPT